MLKKMSFLSLVLLAGLVVSCKDDSTKKVADSDAAGSLVAQQNQETNNLIEQVKTQVANNTEKVGLYRVQVAPEYRDCFKEFNDETAKAPYYNLLKMEGKDTTITMPYILRFSTVKDADGNGKRIISYLRDDGTWSIYNCGFVGK